MNPDEDDTCEPPDNLESRMTVLRDIMSGYDWSYLLDVRDRMFLSRLDEALVLLGLRLHAESGTPVRSGGVWRCEASMTVVFGDESAVFRASAVSDDGPTSAMMSGRAVFSAAGLIGPPVPMDPDGGWLLDRPGA